MESRECLQAIGVFQVVPIRPEYAQRCDDVIAECISI